MDTIEFDYICAREHNDCTNGDVMVLKNIWGDIFINTWNNNDFLDFIHCVEKNIPYKFIFDNSDAGEESYFDYNNHIIAVPQWDYGELYDILQIPTNDSAINNLVFIYNQINNFNKTSE